MSYLTKIGLVSLIIFMSPAVHSSDILDVTRYPVSDVKSVPKAGWLALHKKGSEWMVSPAEVRFIKEVVDEGEFVEVRSSISDTKILVHGISLNIGAVASTSNIENGTVVNSITYQDKVYMLSVIKGYRALSLTTEGRSWIIPKWAESMRVKWGGDLDGDGQLDLVMSCEWQCGWSEKLYLSRGEKISSSSDASEIMHEDKAEILFVSSDEAGSIIYDSPRIKSAPKSGWLAVHRDNDRWTVSPAEISYTEDYKGIEVWSNIPNTDFLIHSSKVKVGPLAGATKILNVVSRIVYRDKTYFLYRTTKGALALTTEEKNWRLDWMEGQRIDVGWAGDLDNDGELDLLVYSELSEALYLSRNAKPNGSINPAVTRSWMD